MAAVPAPRLPQWVPQDDLLLKNALEAGASLESLAKGAVQFSRRFTIRELQNRWHSLLYNDLVASEVADQILLLESSVSNSSKDNKSFSLRGKECISRKRNVESVRRHYYSLTKRTCNEPANFVCRKSLLDPSSYNGDQVENSCKEKFIRGPTDETCIQGQSIVSNKDTDDIPQVLEDNLNVFYDGFHGENFCMDIDDVNSVLLKSPVINDVKGSLVAQGSVLAEDRLHKQLDIVGTGLQSASSDVPNLFPLQCKGSLVAQSSVLAEDRLHKQLDIVGTGLQSASSDVPNLFPLQCNEAPVASHQITYKYEECLFCTLNAEDPDIPDNNDIFPSVEVVCKDEFATRETCDEDPVLLLEGISALVHNLEAPSVHTSDHGKKSEIIELPSSLHAIQDPKPRISEPGLTTDTTFEMHDAHTADGFENSKDFHLNQLNTGLSKCYSHGSQEPDDTSQKLMICSSNSKHQIGEKSIMESMFSTSNHEESTNGSDSDVPYFSDIEAMILDMDLDPCDEESCFAREVSRYQYEDSKKTIIRLEQGANSCMQRAIACHGALAVFYGRQVKYYIKKTEVLIGRATDDVNVDIDLTKEGRANKVSRRQAIIKMEEDGLFYLTNFGKHPISVNSRDVASGHRTSLNSSCLIEITGLRFIFEMNWHFNKQHVSNVALRKFSRGQLEKFEFLPDDNL